MTTCDVRRVLAAGICALALSTPLLAVAQAAAAPLVVIDPGHGGPYSNANANGLREENVNLAVGLELRRQLIARGYRVVMTRTTDRALTLSNIPTWNWSTRYDRWYFTTDKKTGIQSLPKDDLQARVNKANRLGASLFISIHHNGSVNRSVRGTETFSSPRDPLGRSLALLVQNRIVRRTGLFDRKAQTADFYVCRWTNMPAILVEGAFISNPSDARLLKQSSFRRRLAIGIAEGVHTWFSRKPFQAADRPVSAKYPSEAAVTVSRAQFPSGASTVVVANAATWADTPGVPALAASLNAPLLWAGQSGSNERTAVELTRLAPEKLVLVDAAGAFGQPLIERLAAASSLETSSVEVITAPNRSAMAASIAASMTTAPLREVFLIDRDDSASMLAAAPASAAFRVPILLTADARLTAETAAYLAGQDLRACTAILVGDSTGLSSTATQGFAGTVRLATGDLAGRASSINATFYKSSALSPIAANYADGAEYLSAASYAARTKRPILPVNGGILPDQSRLWITNRRPLIRGFEVFDARKKIPASMEHALRKADYE